MLLLLRHGDVFTAAVPGAFISDHRYYEAGFTERYLGLPQESPAAYDKAAVAAIRQEPHRRPADHARDRRRQRALPEHGADGRMR
ncbi:MAG: hypothetical protein V9E87_00475 [Gemmatimonadales bacterium]